MMYRDPVLRLASINLGFSAPVSVRCSPRLVIFFSSLFGFSRSPARSSCPAVMAAEAGDEAVPVAAEQNGSEEGGAVKFASLKPQLVVPARKADEAVRFYKAAFGAEEVKRVSYPKRKAEQDAPSVICAEMRIGLSSLLVCDQNEEAGGTKAFDEGVALRLETEDVRTAVANAVNAGATLDGEVGEMEGPFGGELVGKLKDPFGYVWIVASVGNCCASSGQIINP